jgi:Cft2 family RNA processing exonuclease
MKGADQDYGKVDALIMESTYANEDHHDRRIVEQDFMKHVNEVVERGGTVLIPAFSVANQSYHLIGAQQWRTDQVFSQEVKRKNSQTFIQFLEYLLVGCFPTQKIVLVMDNASYHRSKTVQAALSLFEPRVRVFWLPKYCPSVKFLLSLILRSGEWNLTGRKRGRLGRQRL